MIGKLNRGLTVEFVLVAAFIGLAFRSVVVMFSCILPGIFPVVLSGTVLWLIGEGLQFASVVALTVSFGLGLSARPSTSSIACGWRTSRASARPSRWSARPCWSARP